MATTRRLKRVFLHNRILVIAYTAPHILADRLRCRHKGGHSTLAQKKYNRKKSKKRIVLKGLNTFTTGCFHIIYTYNDDCLPDDADTAYQDMINTFRCMKRLYKKHDIPCNYIGSVERGEQNGRLHCHALFPYSRNIDIEGIKSKWKKGKVIVFFIPLSQVENKIFYVLKNPLRKSISRSFVIPKEEVADITEREFKQITEDPLLIEKIFPGFEVSSIKENEPKNWANNYKNIEIQLRKVKVDNRAKRQGSFYRKGWEDVDNTA